jgi:hypothetical protein
MATPTYKVQCNCNHEFQDKTYGNKVRIATPTARQPSQDTIEVRCTVCSKPQTVRK